MHEATATARKAPRILLGTNLRVLLRRATISADVVSVAVATAAAVAVRGAIAPLFRLGPAPIAADWSLLIPLAAVLVAFYASGLYEREAYVSRPLHVLFILRASAMAFVVSAVAAFFVGPDWLAQPRLVPMLTFVFFIPLDLLLRVGALDAVFIDWVRRYRPTAFVVGDSREAKTVIDRLAELRGFDRVEVLAPSALQPAKADALAMELDHQARGTLPADALFVDSASLAPREVSDITAAARARSVDVYVISSLLGPLEGSRLLNVLFQAPVTRVRKSLVGPNPYALKRALDIVGSVAALILLAPVFMVLAVIIKATSPGPVFYRQTRVGRSGELFEFLKFRSMVVDGDSSCHQEYVRAMIKGDAEPVATDDEGRALFKMVDDPRITPVGRFIRKYSLDELPQLWNVVKGDMSLVGPRPPLPYEASEYDDWQRMRLNVPSGVTGVWQVEGRSRVSFDEMILQDLMYAQNMRLWVDLRLCLKTIPAVLLGGGGG
jgi:exopolysaccharide biosynthesis polyprenyl glycosylphosphotransferase